VHHFSDEVYWRYITFQHLCGSNASFSGEKHIENLKMMEGEFYLEATVTTMETPLLVKIVELKQQLQREQPAQFVKMERLITNIIKKMKQPRISSHATKNKNVPLRGRKKAAIAEGEMQELQEQEIDAINVPGCDGVCMHDNL